MCAWEAHSSTVPFFSSIQKNRKYMKFLFHPQKKENEGKETLCIAVQPVLSAFKTIKKIIFPHTLVQKERVGREDHLFIV